eukprot:6210122-Pleurochrysis_carterae.AAC.5
MVLRGAFDYRAHVGGCLQRVRSASLVAATIKSCDVSPIHALLSIGSIMLTWLSASGRWVHIKTFEAQRQKVVLFAHRSVLPFPSPLWPL